jgi:2-dehydro-3-deoxygluconokinase
VRAQGVGVEGVRRVEGRMGLYFLTPGAGPRPPEVLYDRANSAFAEAEPDLIDWDREMAGADWLHLSGITPAVGPRPAEAARRAVAAAQRAGLTVSFDCNYRQALWERWGGEAAPVLRAIVGHAHLMFGDERDVSLLFGADFGDDDPVRRRRAAADHAFAALPRLQRIASTVRHAHGAESHELSGFLATREETWTTRPYTVTGIVDRIGGGDAFAAGLIHGLRHGSPPQAALEFAVAAGVLKHGVAGDFNLVGQAEIAALVAGERRDVRR